ncbi:MAG TPA: hypothetical protein VG406_13760 [Isosphaeraceae bacterium]|jgi:hypothetical protein|nr:hypothetical protein [Isosphaeraceae bacterium]
MMTGDDNPSPGPPAEGVEVERTGIALVHENERIIAAEGSKAWLGAGDANAVHYYFPVEIEVVGAGDLDALWEMISQALQREIAAHP